MNKGLKKIQIYDPKTKIKRGILVIDNTALGTGKGRIRMMPTVASKFLDLQEL